MEIVQPFRLTRHGWIRLLRVSETLQWIRHNPIDAGWVGYQHTVAASVWLPPQPRHLQPVILRFVRLDCWRY